MRSMLWRNRPPVGRRPIPTARFTRNVRRSQSSANTGSAGGASTGPNPSIPPTSWTPSISACLLQIGNPAAGGRVVVPAVLDRVARDFELAEAIVVDADDHVAGADLRMREHGGDIVDRPARHIGGFE